MDVVYVTATNSVGNNQGAGATWTVTATCGTGQKVVGGGANINNSNAGKGVISASWPSATGTPGAWSGTGYLLTAAGNGVNSTFMTVYAICAPQ